MPAPDPIRSRERRTAAGAIAAAGSVLAASACCLPILPFAMAAGLAGMSALLAALRPWLLGLSVLSIGYGFYQGRQARQCGRRPRRIVSALLWIATAFVAISIFFPQAMANAAADLVDLHFGGLAPSGQAPLQRLAPHDMARFREAFNAAPGRVRVLLLLSPT